MKRLLLFIVTFIVACNTNQSRLNQTWLVVDSGWGNQYFYRSIFTLADDSMQVNHLGVNQFKSSISHFTDSTFQVDTTSTLRYSFAGDTLLLQLSELSENKLKLLEFDYEEKPMVDTSKLFEILVGSKWQFHYSGRDYYFNLLDEPYEDKGWFSAQLSLYDEGKEVFSGYSQELVYWRIDEARGNPVLLVEIPPMSEFEYTPNTFFVMNYGESSINAEAWHRGIKNNFALTRHNLLDSNAFLNKQSMLVGEWHLSTAYPQDEKFQVEDSSNIVDLGELLIEDEEKIKEHQVLVPKDLEAKGLILSLDPNHKFKLIKDTGLLAEGYWELSKDGEVVEINAVSDNHQFSYESFWIKSLKAGSIEIEQGLSIYNGESGFSEKYYSLTFTR